MQNKPAPAGPLDSSKLPIPPVAQPQPQTFTHHGITVADPYAWLRDANYPNVENPQILDYLRAENVYFNAFMAPYQQACDTLFKEIKARQPAEDESVPYLDNGYYYQWRFRKEAQYRTWYRAPVDSPHTWEVLLDEVALANTHSYFRLGALAVSPDNTKLAYSIDVDGSERYQLVIINLDDGSPVGKAIDNTIDTPIWNAQSDALLYVSLNEQWQPLKVFTHQLNNTQADALLFEERNTSYRVSLDLSQSEKFIFINSGGHSDNEVYFLPRSNIITPPTQVASRTPQHEYYVDHGNGEFVIRSNRQTENFDIFRTDESRPGPQHWQLWVNGNQTHYLTGHLVLKNCLVVEERVLGLDQIRIIHDNTDEHYIEFPEAAYTVGLGTNPSFDTNTLRLGYTSLVTPHTVYDYSFETRTLITRKVQKVPSGYNADAYRTRRTMIIARDGVEVPVSLVHHKDTPLDGSAPVYLYAYGAYGYATPPAFSSSRLSLLDRGFVYAIAHIRGGDDLGYHWYLDGKLNKRTNTFNDFVDAAQGLVSLNLAKAGNIAIAGGSAGGELMGAAVNAAPELWGAVVAHVPFVDVLNTMLDASLPLTPPEWSEWGNPIEDPEAFRYIMSYSPYDQLQPGYYPPMLVTAGLHDPRVTYWEPAKYVAKLRSLKEDRNVLLLKTNMEAGHGGQSGRFDALKELAEEYTFVLAHLSPQRLAGANSNSQPQPTPENSADK